MHYPFAILKYYNSKTALSCLESGEIRRQYEAGEGGNCYVASQTLRHLAHWHRDGARQMAWHVLYYEPLND